MKVYFFYKTRAFCSIPCKGWWEFGRQVCEILGNSVDKVRVRIGES